MSITPEQVHAGALAVGWCVGFVCGVGTTIVASIFVACLPENPKSEIGNPQ